MLILAIETSCDETAVALVEVRRNGFFVIDEHVSSQTKIHSPFGGVVPNLAARAHLKNLPMLLEKIVAKNRVKGKDIDLIAVTEGPGLVPALLIGTNAAKALSYAWKKPLAGVHHIAGHIYANFIETQSSAKPKFGFSLAPIKSGQFLKAKLSNSSKPSFLRFPILALIVSGGHTELIFMRKHMDFEIVGQTLDDAGGEAFDKAAKILGLEYPGGPIISAYAEKFKTKIPSPPPPLAKGRNKREGDFQLPRPMISSNNLNFSFSGLKTAVLYTVRDNSRILKSEKLKSELCAEFQQAVIDVLASKTIRAAKEYNPKTILLGGGVSANKELRKQLGNAVKNSFPDTSYLIPDTLYSLDNAAMIAVAGYFKWKFSKNKKSFCDNWRNLEANANLKL